MEKKINLALEIGSSVSDSVGLIKASKQIWDTLRENRIISAFEFCAKQINETGEIDEKVKTKINNYLKSEFGQETTYNLLSKALNADNTLCCKIIGILLGKVTNENRGLTLDEKIIATALKDMLDVEVILLIKLHDEYDNIPVAPVKMRKGNLEELSQDMIKYMQIQNSVSIIDYYNEKLLKGSPEDDIETIQRLKSMLILEDTGYYNNKAINERKGMFRPTFRSLKLTKYARQAI